MTTASLTTAEVCSNQQQLQYIQIAINRAEKVLELLPDEQLSMKWNLGSAVTYLKMAEADMSDRMGFDWRARNIRDSCGTIPPAPNDAVAEVMRKALALAKQQLNNYKTIGEK